MQNTYVLALEMTETTGGVKETLLPIIPGEEGVQAYTADYGVLANPSFKITSEVKAAYNTPPKFTTIKGNPGVIVSYYVTITEAKEQAELVGQRGWVYKYKDRRGGEETSRWYNISIAA